MATCESSRIERVPGYEHLSLFDRPLRDVPCTAVATWKARYPGVRWTIARCDDHISLDTSHGAKAIPITT